MANDGGRAFPDPFVMQEDRDGYREAVSASDYGLGGMSLRDYFAGQALQGLVLACCIANTELLGPARAASAAYEFADAMLTQRASHE